MFLYSAFLSKTFLFKKKQMHAFGCFFVIVAPANVRNQLPRYCQVRKMAIFTNLGVKPRLYRVLVFDYVTLQRSSASHVPLRDERNMRWDSAYVCWSSYTGPYFGLYKHFFTQLVKKHWTTIWSWYDLLLLYFLISSPDFGQLHQFFSNYTKIHDILLMWLFFICMLYILNVCICSLV